MQLRLKDQEISTVLEELHTFQESLLKRDQEVEQFQSRMDAADQRSQRALEGKQTQIDGLEQKLGAVRSEKAAVLEESKLKLRLKDEELLALQRNPAVIDRESPFNSPRAMEGAATEGIELRALVSQLQRELEQAKKEGEGLQDTLRAAEDELKLQCYWSHRCKAA